MKKTVNVNIGGVHFIIDDDAFNVLRKYLNEIEIRLGDDCKEVLEDIETRVADIFNENISPRTQVVNLDLVKRAISIIGSAREFGEPQRSARMESEYDNESCCAPHPPRKLYRSRTNVVIGGVCAGIAEYFNVDLTLVRILTFCLVFFGGLTLWVYIILWIAVPRKPLSVSDTTWNDHNEKRK